MESLVRLLLFDPILCESTTSSLVNSLKVPSFGSAATAVPEINNTNNKVSVMTINGFCISFLIFSPPFSFIDMHI